LRHVGRDEWVGHHVVDLKMKETFNIQIFDDLIVLYFDEEVDMQTFDKILNNFENFLDYVGIEIKEKYREMAITAKVRIKRGKPTKADDDKLFEDLVDEQVDESVDNTERRRG